MEDLCHKEELRAQWVDEELGLQVVVRWVGEELDLQAADQDRKVDVDLR